MSEQLTFTEQQLAEAINNVGCYTDLGAELIAASVFANHSAQDLNMVDQPAPMAVPEVVATFDGLYLTPLKSMERGTELMTVAQHQRITAAMAAELAAINGQKPIAWRWAYPDGSYSLVYHGADGPSKDREDGCLPWTVQWIYAMPPAAQDVSGLVEALEWCEDWFDRNSPTSKVDGFFPVVHPMLTSIRNALAAHRQSQQREGEA